MVSERGLIQRINRALAKQDECLKKSRPGSRMEIDYGTYYSVNLRTNNIAQAWNDLEKLGRDLEVLKQYEALAK